MFDAFGVVRDDGKISAGRLIRFTTPLFPIAERAKGNMIAGGKFLLRQAKRTAQGLDPGDTLHTSKIGVGQRLCIGVAQRRFRHGLVAAWRDGWHDYFFFGTIRLEAYHRAVTLHSDESRCLAHGVWPCVLK